MLPNFLIVGTQKAGTTSLWSYLRAHPNVFMPETKEINFFRSSANNWERGIEWYERFFEEHDGERAVGEASPRYMFYENVPPRIRRVNEDMRLVFILRNPVDRAYSHYWHTVRNGEENLPFEQAIEREEERVRRSEFAGRAYSYVSRGFYHEQIERFLEHFPREQLLIHLFRDLKEEPVDLVQRTYRFLDVDPEFVPDEISRTRNPSRVPKHRRLHALVHSRRSPLRRAGGALLPDRMAELADDVLTRLTTAERDYPPMDDDLRRDLYERFEDDIERLEQLLDEDLSHWKE